MTIFLDASAIIYLVEGIDPWYGHVREVLSNLLRDHGRSEFAVSGLSWLECRVKPLREGDTALLEHYRVFFSQPGLRTVTLDAQVIDRAASIRAAYRLKTPDALQAASAMVLEEETVFLTGDASFEIVPSLRVMPL